MRSFTVILIATPSTILSYGLSTSFPARESTKRVLESLALISARATKKTSPYIRCLLASNTLGSLTKGILAKEDGPL